MVFCYSLFFPSTISFFSMPIFVSQESQALTMFPSLWTMPHFSKMYAVTLIWADFPPAFSCTMMTMKMACVYHHGLHLWREIGLTPENDCQLTFSHTPLQSPSINLVLQLSFTFPSLIIMQGCSSGSCLSSRALPNFWNPVYKINPFQMGEKTIPKEPSLPTFCSNSADGVNIQGRGGSSGHSLDI